LLAGGAKTAQQHFAAGLVDEMAIDVVPTLLGGERLFEDVGDSLHGLELLRTVAAPTVTHLTFGRRRPQVWRIGFTGSTCMAISFKPLAEADLETLTEWSHGLVSSVRLMVRRC
jgi:hypothetical protein